MKKNILITGVSRGLGLAIARAVIDEGGTVYGVSRTLSSEYAELVEGNPDRATFHAFDLSDFSALNSAKLNDILGKGMSLDGVVSNAAMAYDDLISNLDSDVLGTLFSVNVFAPMMLTRAAIRRMLLTNTRGSIVHISSVSAHTGYKGLAMYASTKGALEAFSKNTAREWGERGIRSNCVVPGFMETDMSASLSETQTAKIYRRTALKTATSLESVAATVVFLLSDKSKSITGQNLFVDAGTI